MVVPLWVRWRAAVRRRRPLRAACLQRLAFRAACAPSPALSFSYVFVLLTERALPPHQLLLLCVLAPAPLAVNEEQCWRAAHVIAAHSFGNWVFIITGGYINPYSKLDVVFMYERF